MIEQESRESRQTRNKRKVRLIAAEAVLAIAFLAGVFIARDVGANADAPLAKRSLATLFPILVLTLWWVFYFVQIKRLDELERSIEIRSLAIACAITVWITTVWGLLSLFLGAPGLQIVFVAPLAAAIYGVIRAILVFGYR